ncbi:hypothetical protein AVEN_146148-1 [Araneus ventricosus]|uniref:Uncharacterized protein n=1 Tax=Araneus ventricosus TaxID=182803 RepID=A0A4Y2EFJ8_ARAVE|nr:hypothetical protein AVEN_146148-1 [Araneus ventricosus]
MKTAIVLGLCLLLVLHQSSVDAQRNRGDVRGGYGTLGSGGPSGARGGISFPSRDERRREGGGGGSSSRNLHAGRWPGGFYNVTLVASSESEVAVGAHSSCFAAEYEDSNRSMFVLSLDPSPEHGGSAEESPAGCFQRGSYGNGLGWTQWRAIPD